LKILILSKHTALENRRSDPRIKELLRRKDPSVDRMVPAHDEHMRALHEVIMAADRLGLDFEVLYGARSELPAGFDAIVTVGGDGTVLAASHSPVCDGVPILGVNSAPSFSVGNFCRSSAATVERDLVDLGNSVLGMSLLTRMTVSLNGKDVSNRVLNEALVADACPAAMSRYILRYGTVEEEQRSSGFWIGTSSGSTGAQRSAGGDVFGDGTARFLQIVVRELFQTSEPAGRWTGRNHMLVEEMHAVSKMASGTMWLDGSHRMVPFTVGDVLSFRESEVPLRLLGRR
jgi:NAD+ kinase